MGFRRSAERFYHDTGGQVLLFGAVMVLAILAFLLVIPNGTQVTTQKVRSQTAADAGAFTGSVWLSRGLNLSSSMNVGIKSVYTWMTVLTVGEALAKALYSDTLDSTVHALGGNITQALFGSSNPTTVHSNEYPAAIRKLDSTALWLSSLQLDIATTFSNVAATLGSEEASRNAGTYPATYHTGGWATVKTNDSVPLLVQTPAGDSMLYADLLELGPALDTIPTLDPNITPATGLIVINESTWDIRAYYDDTSEWMDRTDSLYHCYKKPIIQVFQHGSIIDSGVEYFDQPGGGSYVAYLHGDSWARWIDVCHEGTHHPFIWPNGTGNSPYKNTAYWTLVNAHPGNNRYKLDTVWTTRHLAKRDDTSSMNDVYPPGESAWIHDHGDDSITHHWIPTGFYTGAESTVPIKGPKVRPSRVNPDREFHTVCYVWRQGSPSSPYGLGPPVGGSLFPRHSVAAASPMMSVARSVPFITTSSTAGYEYFFTPAWDVRLTPMDSLGVVEITSDTAYGTHTRNSFVLEDLRKYVLLP